MDWNRNLQRIHDFWNGQTEARALLSVSDYGHRDPHGRQDIDKIVSGILNTPLCPGVNLPAYCPDFGTVSTAEYWGGIKTFAGNHVHVEPVARTVAEALEIVPRPATELDAGAAVAIFGQLRQRLPDLPLWMRTFDMQGAANTAALIVDQCELLTAFYETPELCHRLLARINDHLMAMQDYFRAASGNRVVGTIWPYVFFPQEQGFAQTEDMMPLVGPDIYEEFCIPYLRVLDRRYGGLGIHCCGEYAHQLPVLARSGLRIKYLEFHYPFVKPHDLYAALGPAPVYVPFLNAKASAEFPTWADFVRWLARTTPPDMRFYFAQGYGGAADEPHAVVREAFGAGAS